MSSTLKTLKKMCKAFIPGEFSKFIDEIKDAFELREREDRVHKLSSLNTKFSKLQQSKSCIVK